MLMYLPLIIVLISLQFLPERIPAHYGLDGQVTRWGSKYEMLLMPIVSILMGYFFFGIAKYCAKQEENGHNNETICVIAGILVLFLFNVMTGYTLYTGMHQVADLSRVTIDISQLLYEILGVALILIGNVMPKLRKNAVIGLRTKWSMKNETTWRKSQHFGGISLLIGGLIILIACFFVKGIACSLLTVGVLTVVLIVDVLYTYKVAQIYS